MTKSLSIVGAGRVGRALGSRLKQAGWQITLVTAQTEASAKRGTRFIGAGRPAAGVPATLACASVILITVSDDALVDVTQKLAENAREELRGKVVLHTSGAVGSGVLEPLRSLGATVGSMHPMQTFNGVSVPPLEGKVFGIEGDETAVRIARKIARSVGAVPVGIAAESKPMYHAAGAFAASLTLAMEEAGVRVMMSTGLKRREAERALLSLTRQVLDNYEKLGPQRAWTGPLSRGDFGVVAAHENALRDLPAEYLEGYRAVSRLSARVLSHDPAAMLSQLENISASKKLAARAKGGAE
jgi:predicted short-subunit dehydrogenase-like oxidoreductase (DUF2520 family)